MNLYLALAAALVLGVSTGPVSSQPAPLNENNWTTHPAIVAINAVFTEIEGEIASKRLEHRHLSAKPKSGGGDILLDFFQDSAGTRKMIADWAYTDSFMTYRYYYDNHGVLRLVIVSAIARNGTAKEYRLYYDAAGAKIWETATTTRGPGYDFPDDKLHIVVNPDEIYRLILAQEPYPE